MSYSIFKILYNGFSFIKFIALALAFLLLSFSIFLIFAKEETKKNAIIMFTSSIIMVYLSNFLVEKLFFESDKTTRRLRIERSKILGNPYDERSKFEVVSELKNIDIRSYPTFGPKDFIEYENSKEKLNLFPLGNVSNANIVLGNELGYWSVYKSDRYGFNNENKIYNTDIDLMLIGDSFVEGSAVWSSLNYAGNLIRLGKNTANFGRVGNGPYLNYAIMREYAKKIKPKTVLWIHCENDLNNLHTRKNLIKNTILHNYLEDENFSQSLLSKQDEIDELIKNHIYEKTKTYIEKSNTILESMLKFITLESSVKFINRFFVKKDSDYLISIDNYSEIILKAKKLSKEIGSDFVFVYVPIWGKYGLNDSNYWPFEYKKKLLMNIRKNNVHIIDIDERIDMLDNPLKLWPFELSGHFNEEGYRFVSEIINRELK